MLIREYPLSFYLGLIDAEVPFAFARYGDGEWNCLLGADPQKVNCDGSHYAPQLKAWLGDSLVYAHAPPCFYGMQSLSLRLMAERIEPFLARVAPAIPWHAADVFHLANAAGALGPLVARLRRGPSLLIGPAYLHEDFGLKFSAYTRVPAADAHGMVDSIVRVAARQISLLRMTWGAPPIVCVCAGMTAKVIIYRLWRELADQRPWLLDLGAVFDLYVPNGRTRSYFAGVSEAAKRANLGLAPVPT